MKPVHLLIFFGVLLHASGWAGLAQREPAPAAPAKSGKTAPAPPATFTWQEGDLLFQSLNKVPLVEAIEGCTHSPWSHCGILHRTPQGWVVLKAIGPVRQTPLLDWLNQARDQRFAAYRLNDALQPKIPDIIRAAKTWLGRPYDIRYDLDDQKIYCSELIYKACQKATGETLGKLQKLGDLNWKPYRKLIETIEQGPAPLARLMITPRSLSEATQLTKVYHHPPRTAFPRL